MKSIASLPQIADEIEPRSKKASKTRNNNSISLNPQPIVEEESKSNPHQIYKVNP